MKIERIIERLTDKAREALKEALDLAQEYNHGHIEVEHLLDTLLRQEGGIVQQVIQKAGGNLAAAQRIVEGDIENMPHVYGASEPGIGARLHKVLEDAWNEMNAFHDEYLSVEHMLLAMFKSNGTALRALQAAGLNRNEVLKALTTIRGAHHITD